MGTKVRTVLNSVSLNSVSLESWQHFADDLRTDNPLLAPETWVRALREAGFEDAVASPEPGSPASDLGQHVIVARVPGAAPLTVEDDAGTEGAVRGPAREAVADRSEALRRQLLESLPADRIDLLRELVREAVMRILRLDPTEPPARSARLMDMGFDSLMAVQLRNQLGASLQLDKPLQATLLFDHPTIDALADFLLARFAPAGAPVAAPVAAPRAEVLGTEAVAALSDREIEALLAERLGKP